MSAFCRQCVRLCYCGFFIAGEHLIGDSRNARSFDAVIKLNPKSACRLRWSVHYLVHFCIECLLNEPYANIWLLYVIMDYYLLSPFCRFCSLQTVLCARLPGLAIFGVHHCRCVIILPSTVLSNRPAFDVKLVRLLV